MARWEFKLPDIGEGVAEGEIVAWLVAPGDSVTEDQPVVEVMTDKATVTITAPKTGKVLETRGKVGEIIPVHAVLVVFELDGGALGVSADAGPLPVPSTSWANGTKGHAPPARREETAATAVGDLRETLPGMSGTGRAIESAYFNDRPLATPATRKLARELDVDLRAVQPTGPAGRVTRRDVESFKAPAAPPPAAQESRPDVRPAAFESESDEADERVPFVGMRRKIAQKMTQSKTTAAHYTFVEECDVTELKALRGRLKAVAEARGVKLSFLPFVVKAVVAALKKHPYLNATLDEAKNEIVLQRRYHMGIATATDAGLVVPVVRDADKKSVLAIAQDIERLSSDARSGKAKNADLHGSTFTITSLGAKGGLFASPIINFPEVAILGVHQIKTRPVVRDGQIAIGDVMLLSLSFDHRIVDGHVGAAFALEVIAYLERPETLFLEMV